MSETFIHENFKLKAKVPPKKGLAEMRKEYRDILKKDPKTPKEKLDYINSTSDEAPVPGGIGAGTVFKDWILTAPKGQSEVQMYMTYDLRNMGNKMNMYLTSCNRTLRGCEVLFSFLDINSFAIYDWSIPEENKWGVWIDMNTIEPKYITTKSVMDGTPRQYIWYRNNTKCNVTFPKTLTKIVPWTNSVSLYNFIAKRWVVIYSRIYTGTRLEVMPTGNRNVEGGWWGPIVETFETPNEQPADILYRIGFYDARIKQLPDTSYQLMTPNITEFGPPQPPLVLPYKTDFHSYLAVGQSHI